MAIKLSIGIWAFAFGPYSSSPKSLEEILERAARAGYDGVELSGYPPHVHPEAFKTPASQAALRDRLSSLNLGVSGYSADLGAVNPILPANRKAYLDLFRRTLDVAAGVGSPSLRIDTGSAPGVIPDEDYHTSFHRLADLWRECADFARHAGLTILWEFEPGFAFNKPSEVMEMHERVGHPFFRILFDTAHAYTCGVVGAKQHGRRETLEGGVGEFLDTIHDAIGGVHLTDTDGTLYCDDTTTHVPLGEGHVPFAYIAPKLLTLPHTRWWCVDLCFWPKAWDIVEASHERARAIIAAAS
jgi:sugar phosphate isomerase/epimerase